MVNQISSDQIDATNVYIDQLAFNLYRAFDQLDLDPVIMVNSRKRYESCTCAVMTRDDSNQQLPLLLGLH